jgi:hypothetical protein
VADEPTKMILGDTAISAIEQPYFIANAVTMYAIGVFASAALPFLRE